MRENAIIESFAKKEGEVTSTRFLISPQSTDIEGVVRSLRATWYIITINSLTWSRLVGRLRCLTHQFCVHQHYAISHSKLSYKFENWVIMI